MKFRKNLTFSPETWRILEILKKIKGQSISHILEEAVNSYLKIEKINPLYVKLMLDRDIEYLSEKENKELTGVLDRLKEEDITVVKRVEI